MLAGIDINAKRTHRSIGMEWCLLYNLISKTFIEYWIVVGFLKYACILWCNYSYAHLYKLALAMLLVLRPLFMQWRRCLKTVNVKQLFLWMLQMLLVVSIARLPSSIFFFFICLLLPSYITLMVHQFVCCGWRRNFFHWRFNHLELAM